MATGHADVATASRSLRRWASSRLFNVVLHLDNLTPGSERLG